MTDRHLHATGHFATAERVHVSRKESFKFDPKA